MTKKINLGLFTNNPGFGGSEVYVADLLNGLDPQKYNKFLFCTRNSSIHQLTLKTSEIQIVYIDEMSPSKDIEPAEMSQKEKKTQLSVKNILISAVPSWLKLWMGFLKEAWRLKSIFKKYELDIFHSNEVSPCFESALLAAKLAKIPFIVATSHTLPMTKLSDLRLRYRIINKIGFYCLNIWIATSQAQKNYWVKVYKFNLQKVTYIYNGIPIPDENSLDEDKQFAQRLKVDVDSPLVLCPARLNETKGQNYLLNAVPEILQAIPNFQLLLAGDGPLKEEMEVLAKSLNIQKSVKFLGHRNDIQAIMKLSDIIILSSIDAEALPYALSEAMVLKKPTIGTNFSGLPEIIDDGKTGILIPLKDPHAIATAVIKILSNPELAKQMGEAGRRRVKELFSIERMVQEVEKVYNQRIK